MAGSRKKRDGVSESDREWVSERERRQIYSSHKFKDPLGNPPTNCPKVPNTCRNPRVRPLTLIPPIKRLGIKIGCGYSGNTEQRARGSHTHIRRGKKTSRKTIHRERTSSQCENNGSVDHSYKKSVLLSRTLTVL